MRVIIAIATVTSGCYAAVDGPTAIDARVDAPVVSFDAAPDAPPLARIANGLLALYDFDEGAGTSVRDTSGNGSPLDLAIDGSTTWLNDALRVDGDALIASSVAATKITNAVIASGAITVEAWVKPANLTQTGPSRIVTCSVDTSNRNFQIAQKAGQFNARVRSTTTGLNGSSPEVNAGAVDLALTHYVMTRDNGGTVRLYENAVEITDVAQGGEVTNWDASYRLAIANELSRDRDWLGEIHLVAIYDRALPIAEIEQNYEVGAAAP